MAQISIQAASVSLRSAWTVVSRRVYNAAGEWTGETRNEYTRPSTDNATRVFDLSALPSAAVIDGAVLTARPTGAPVSPEKTWSSRCRRERWCGKRPRADCRYAGRKHDDRFFLYL